MELRWRALPAGSAIRVILGFGSIDKMLIATIQMTTIENTFLKYCLFFVQGRF